MKYYSNLKSIRLLYVENDDTLVNQVIALLKPYFDTIYVSKDGDDGLSSYHTYQPDLVISSILMPGMNGLEMAKAIKASNIDQVILLTSSFSDPKYIFQAVEIGIDAYLFKPLDMGKLLDKIHHLSKSILQEKKLSRQIEHLHIMMNSNPNMMFMVSESGIEYLNQTLQDFVGYQPSESGDYSNFCLFDYFQSSELHNDMLQTKQDLIQIFIEQPDKQHILQFKPFDSAKVNNTVKPDYSFSLSMTHEKDTDYYIFSLANISKLTDEFQRLEKSANQDSLTGIANRAKYNQVIEHYIERSHCCYEAFSVIFFDIDHFKRVNDHYGHDVGDKTLKKLTQLVSHHIRERDFFARWGGEEFIILLRGSKIESATKTAEYLRNLIEINNFDPVNKLTCSFAVVDFKATDSPECLLKRADVVLYRAKAAGRNCVKTYQIDSLLDHNPLLNENVIKERRIDYSKPLIIVADDDYMQRLPVRTVLEKFNFQVKEAENGVQALELFQQFDPDLVILDVIMPEMDGFETCRELRKFSKGKYLPILMLTGLDDVDSINQAYQDGATDFLSKPVNWILLGYKIQYLLRSAKISQTLALREVELLETQQDIINRLAIAAEHRDSETGGHILRMSHYSFELCKAMGLGHEKCDLLLKSSPMHDVGKIGIADNILLKPEKLTSDEFEKIKKHTTIGAEILSNNKSLLLESAYTIALTHHEKWDGSGYPQGLSGTDIPEFGRICAITDVFDALTSERPYKKAWDAEDAFKAIHEGAGLHFDPQMVEKFLGISERILDIKKMYSQNLD